jgi:hypothetical protein
LVSKEVAVPPATPLVPFIQERFLPNTPTRIPSINFRQPPLTLEFGKLATKYLSNYLLGDKKTTDTTYGLKKDPEGETSFSIGNTNVEIANDDITVGGKTYKGTEGLWSLLTLKEPDENLVTQEDMENYKEIVVMTSAHKKSYNPEAQISANSGSKYKKIIAPMFSKSGEGLREVTGNAIDYVYWNDPNELVNRLRLLILSKDAGNTGVDNEIDSILEELRESGIIY